ncbi:hypothetical protein V9T40_007458 [Parthenolecanium corni]|uniref:Uncharacterized protein n=1 Tax=Parthenolecanium corni TaxID=536013 RepID=A0AAN9Y644_9HEMI
MKAKARRKIDQFSLRRSRSRRARLRSQRPCGALRCEMKRSRRVRIERVERAGEGESGGNGRLRVAEVGRRARSSAAAERAPVVAFDIVVLVLVDRRHCAKLRRNSVTRPTAQSKPPRCSHPRFGSSRPVRSCVDCARAHAPSCFRVDRAFGSPSSRPLPAPASTTRPRFQPSRADRRACSQPASQPTSQAAPPLYSPRLVYESRRQSPRTRRRPSPENAVTWLRRSPSRSFRRCAPPRPAVRNANATYRRPSRRSPGQRLRPQRSLSRYAKIRPIVCQRSPLPLRKSKKNVRPLCPHANVAATFAIASGRIKKIAPVLAALW